MLDRIRNTFRNWCTWLVDRTNDVAAAMMWLALNTPVLPPELLAMLPAPVKAVLPVAWWAFVKWAARKKAQAAVIKAVADGK